MVKVVLGVNVIVNVAEGVNVSRGKSTTDKFGSRDGVAVNVIVGVGDISPPVFGMRTVILRRSTSIPP